MTRYMGVAKAAKLLGVSRENLQRLIRRGDLQTFEGQVDLEVLKKRFPALALDDSSAVERAQSYAIRLTPNACKKPYTQAKKTCCPKFNV